MSNSKCTGFKLNHTHGSQLADADATIDFAHVMISQNMVVIFRHNQASFCLKQLGQSQTLIAGELQYIQSILTIGQGRKRNPHPIFWRPSALSQEEFETYKGGYPEESRGMLHDI